MRQIQFGEQDVGLGLPWWQVIGATTLTLRFLLFPVVVVAQRNMVTLNNHQVSEFLKLILFDLFGLKRKT